MSVRRHFVAAATLVGALALPLATACVPITAESSAFQATTTGRYEYPDLEQQVADAGFAVKPGSGTIDVNGMIRFAVDLQCTSGDPVSLAIPDPSVVPLHLQADIVIHPASNIVAAATVQYATQPSPANAQANDLCRVQTPPMHPQNLGTDVETTYRNAGFNVIAGSFRSFGHRPGIKIDLGCQDGHDRWFPIGTITNTTLAVRLVPMPDPRATNYEFTGQPTVDQVRDYNLCS